MGNSKKIETSKIDTQQLFKLIKSIVNLFINDLN